MNGCWVADGDGNLDYVPEASYTEELWEEMRKRNNMLSIPKEPKKRVRKEKSKVKSVKIK